MDWSIRTWTAVYTGDKVWFSNYSYNGLFCMNSKDFTIEFIDFFPDEKIDVVCCHRRALSYNDLIIFSPWHGHNLHIYSTTTNKFVTIPVKKKISESVADMFIIGDKLYVFRYDITLPIMIVDLITFEVMEDSSFNEECKKEGITSGLSSENVIYRDGKAWFVIREREDLYSWDIQEKKLDIYTVPGKHLNAFPAYDMFLIEDLNEKNLIKWDFHNAKPYPVVGCDIKFSSILQVPYYNIVEFEGDIYAFPGYSAFILKGDGEKFVKWTDFDFEIKPSINPLFNKYLVVDDTLWMLSFESDILLRFDKNMKLIDKRRLYITDTQAINTLWNALKDTGRIFKEGESVSFEGYLELVKSGIR